MPFTSAPTLLTTRLELRAHQASDLSACLHLWTDPVVTQYTVGQPLSRQDVWTRLLRHPGHWTLLGFGYWLVTERDTGKVVGEVGLANFKRTLVQDQPHLDNIPEAGWVFLPEVHGRGYASEALTAVLNWRDTELPGQQTWCMIHPDNAPSLKLAEKFGFKITGEVGDEQPRTLLLMRETRPRER